MAHQSLGEQTKIEAERISRDLERYRLPDAIEKSLAFSQSYFAVNSPEYRAFRDAAVALSERYELNQSRSESVSRHARDADEDRIISEINRLANRMARAAQLVDEDESTTRIGPIRSTSASIVLVEECCKSFDGSEFFLGPVKIAVDEGDVFALMGPTRSVLMSAIYERFRLRTSQENLSTEEIEADTVELRRRLLGIAETIEKKSASSSNEGLKSIKHVLLLLHGIRTHADWFETVDSIFSADTCCEVVPIRYGYFDLAKFLFPFAFARAVPIKKIKQELQNAKAKYLHAKISVIAHSFGTYALMHAIRNDPGLEIFRVILCGSVVPEHWDLESYFITREEATNIVNDCGVRDVWPVLARCCTWGYGASGTFGKAGVGVRDRKFPFSHSDFFNPRFISRYWVPFIQNGEIVRPETNGISMRSPTLITVLSSPLFGDFIRVILWTVIPSLLIVLTYVLAKWIAFP